MLGIDLVEHARLRGMEEKFKKRLLSALELACYESFSSEKRKLEYLASRFAAKEAIFKVYKKGDGSLNFRDISILNAKDGSPYIVCDAIKDKLAISLSHTENYSIAVVLKIC